MPYKKKTKQSVKHAEPYGVVSSWGPDASPPLGRLTLFGARHLLLHAEVLTLRELGAVEAAATAAIPNELERASAKASVASFFLDSKQNDIFGFWRQGKFLI